MNPVATARGTDLFARSARGFRQNITTATQAVRRGECLSIDQRHFLSRQSQSGRRMATQNRQSPGFAHFMHVGGTDHEQMRDRAQGCEMFDWLMRRTIFTEPD